MSSHSQVETKHRLTSYDVWRFAWKYSYWIIVLLAIPISILAGWVFGNMLRAFATGLWIAFTLIVINDVCRKIYSRRFAGQIVKDYGKPSKWLIFASCAPLFILFFFFFTETAKAPFEYLPGPLSYVFAFLFWCSLSILLIFGSMGHLQLRENGISLYGHFVDWDWVEAYCWGVETKMLYLQGKDRIFHCLLHSQPFNIAPEHRDVVDEWLKQSFGSQSILR